MTKTKITEDQFDCILFWFHKWFRIADCKGDAEMWNAIHNLEEDDYAQAMKDAMKEAGIIIQKVKK